MKTPGKYLWPAAAVLAGGIAAWGTRSAPPTATVAYSAAAASPEQGPAPTPPSDGVAETAGERVHGKVLETIIVPNYVYLRIEASDPKRELWAAVASAEVKAGQTVTVVGAQRMDNFKSSTLNRTFDLIYFGALDEGTSKLPPGHPNIAPNMPTNAAAANDNTRSVPIQQPTPGANPASPHGSPSAGGDQIPVGKVERAAGKLGHTVAEIVGNRKALAGQKVRVRGVVVKSTSGVLGKTFAHLRDGTGSANAGDHDVTVTTEQAATVGSPMLFEGTVVTDKDFGAGYSYPVLIENAKTVTE